RRPRGVSKAAPVPSPRRTPILKETTRTHIRRFSYLPRQGHPRGGTPIYVGRATPTAWTVRTTGPQSGKASPSQASRRAKIGLPCQFGANDPPQRLPFGRSLRYYAQEADVEAAVASWLKAALTFRGKTRGWQPSKRIASSAGRSG